MAILNRKSSESDGLWGYWADCLSIVWAWALNDHPGVLSLEVLDP